MKVVRALIQLVLVAVILAGGALLAKRLIDARKKPPKVEREVPAPLVEYQQVERRDIPVVVRGYGTVEPRTEVAIVPEVSGKVIFVNENLVNGGFIKAGDVLLEIDPADYELALQQAEANIERAKVKLETEQAEAEVARQEWETMRPGEKPDSPLVLREAQIRQAKAELAAARAELAKAKLNLSRTRITLPYDGRVASESIDQGQFVNVGQSVASVYATDVVEITVPLEDSKLAWFDVPMTENGSANPQKGTTVDVSAEFAGQVHHWKGRIDRIDGRIDQRSRMVHVIVSVQDPFETTDGSPPLVPGMFVEVAIEGDILENIIAVPRYAVHNGDEIWRIEGNRLRIAKVDIARQDKGSAYIRSGLHDGDLIVVSPMDVVTDGMEIRTSGGTLQPDRPRPETPADSSSVASSTIE